MTLLRWQFGSMYPVIQDLIRADPRVASWILSAGPADLHAALLLLQREGADLSDNGTRQRFATALVEGQIRHLVRRWCAPLPPGLFKTLGKLPPEPQEPWVYRALLDLLREAAKAKVLWHADAITPAMLTALQSVDPGVVSKPLIQALAREDAGQAFPYLRIAIRKYRPELDDGELREAFSRVRNDNDLRVRFHRLIEHARFPEPPWPGNERLRPLCSHRDVAQIARRLENCAARETINVLGGSSYFYQWRGEPLAIVSVWQDAVLGWIVGEIGIARNEEVPADLDEQVRQAFAGSGINASPSADIARNKLGIWL